ncbi:glycerol kinase GlpK [Arthrobacter sp. H-02-3]|uniref:glycerol kinase GlpK n=1 Tax=Arthrobacter sp. H-02-3 TaxID=2703675 RepID=UPI000DD29702|nr:glycerol kinase GlpK [Arthrobacter sp. H-02-3]PVZ58438.1 glycerol kinase [Arthrobacter sp. H-02-3]
MTTKYIMALDAGTTGIRAIIYNSDVEIVGEASQEFTQIYPKPGWVEHDPMEIWNTQLAVARRALLGANIDPHDIGAIGVTNQRETTVIWDRGTGKPIMNAIVWQDRRTAGACDGLKEKGLEDHVRSTTGLVIDAYFSGTKIAWMLDNVPGARVRAEAGELCFGTIDSWLIWNLTAGAAHVTDYSNAARTMLFNINTLDWDDKLLTEIGVPRLILPEVRPSSEIYGYTCDGIFAGAHIPVAAAIGDQQAALFGQACFDRGMVKATYGTGASLVMNTGDKPVSSANGMLTTIAWGIGGKVEYALEGLIFVAAASIQWLRDELRVIYDAADSEYAAMRVEDSGGVYVVPAFTGLAAPYWDPYARGAILGLTRGSSRNHIIRATLESIAFQIKDVINCMEADAGLPVSEIRVDGGAVRNNFLMQFQADMVNVPVLRPRQVESTARGAALLAGLACGFWNSQDELRDTFALDRAFVPDMSEEKRSSLYAGWQKAVARACDWEEHESTTPPTTKL